MRVDVDGYAADHCGLRLTPPPVPPSTAAEAVALVLGQGGAAASAADVDALAAQVAGGMRLTLSQQVCVRVCMHICIYIIRNCWNVGCKVVCTWLIGPHAA